MAYLNSRRGLGQVTPTVAPVIAPGGVTYTSGSPGFTVLAPITSGPAFVRKVRNVPGDPYILNITSEDIEKNVYANSGISRLREQTSSGVNSQVVVKTGSGLEVPEYILRRDLLRKQNAEVESEIERTKPIFWKVSEYAINNPGTAGVIALGLGMMLAARMYGEQ